MLTLRFSVCGFLCITLLIGCSNVPAELTKKTEVVAWGELDEFSKPEIGMGIFRSAQMGDEETLRKTLADPKIEEMVTAFEKAPVPKKFASKAREDLKNNVVREFKVLISSAKMGSSYDELKTGADSISQNLGKLKDPTLK